MTTPVDAKVSAVLASLQPLQETLSAEKSRLRQFLIEERRRLEPESLSAFDDLNSGVIRSEPEEEDLEYDVDIFAVDEPPVKRRRIELVAEAQHAEDHNDAEGYYLARVGTVLGGRYRVAVPQIGKGVFSSVVECVDLESNTPVAVKIIRFNDMMRKEGEHEKSLLTMLEQSESTDRTHIIQLLNSFDHCSHLCLVFERMWGNLRKAIRLSGDGRGLKPDKVCLFARQLVLGLRHLRQHDLIHADLKPDNVLVDDTMSRVKICDLGSASHKSQNEVTQYLVSRFYRAPEIILGCKYSPAIDMWSLGCTVFEIATGHILFNGHSNNEMLRKIMEVKGKIPSKLIKQGQFGSLHFDNNNAFHSRELDQVTGAVVVRVLKDHKPIRHLKDALQTHTAERPANNLDSRLVASLADFLERCLSLDPAKRFDPEAALNHPYLRCTGVLES